MMKRPLPPRVAGEEVKELIDNTHQKNHSTETTPVVTVRIGLTRTFSKREESSMANKVM